MPPSFFAIVTGIGPCLRSINPRYESEAYGAASIIIPAVMEAIDLPQEFDLLQAQVITAPRRERCNAHPREISTVAKPRLTSIG